MMFPTLALGPRAGIPRRALRPLGWACAAFAVAACTSVRETPPGPRIARAPRAITGSAIAQSSAAAVGPRRVAGPIVRSATPAVPSVAVGPGPLARPPRPAAPAGGPAPASVRIDERVSAAVDSNPARSTHAIVVTVADANGRPLANQRVEWILSRSPSAVGDIVGADDQGKVNNQYAVTTTNGTATRLDAGDNHPSMDASGARLADVTVGPGQTWITLSSAQEGTTDVLVYVPGIRDGTRNKVFARAIWADYDVAFPPDVTAAVTGAGAATRDLHVAVRRATDGESLPGQTVEAEILDDDAGAPTTFAGGARTAEVTTSPDGTATFTVENPTGARGASRVRLTARGTFHDSEIVRSHVVEVRWTKGELSSRLAVAAKDVPVGQPFDAVLSVTNSGDAPIADVRIEPDLGSGVAPAEGTTFPVEVGALAPGQTVERTVRLVATADGAHEPALVASSPSLGIVAKATGTVSALQGRLAVLARCEPPTAEAGGQVRFVVEVTNAGRGALEDVVVAGVYPEGITPKTAGRIEIGALAPGQSDAYEFLGVATRGGTFKNVARASAKGVEEASAECELRVLACALEIAMACPDWIALGEAGTFRVRVTNTGDGPATGTVLRVSHGPCLDGGLLDVPLGDIAPGATASHEWHAVGVANSKCAVQVDVVARGCEARAECPVEVGGLAAIDSTMSEQTVDRTKRNDFKVGDEFFYVLELGNEASDDPTPPLRVLLSLPKELQFVSAQTESGIEVRGAGSDPRGGVVGVLANGPAAAAGTSDFRLAPGQRTTIQFRVKVVAPPSEASRLVRAQAVVQRATDGTELSSETESTRIDK
jgi:uncharacterized repeat protein (TIGR01451 family)